VVAGEAGRGIPAALWSAGAESFLANGIAGGEHDARQPILIADDVVPANGARFLALADGVWREPGEGDFDRVLLVFGEAERMAARETWRL
jgi:DNA polymerase-3 subunit chi